MKKIPYQEANLTDTAVALGKFEGLHRGHQLLLDEIVVRSEQEGLTSVVTTIDMDAASRIYTIEERDTLFEQMGMDYNVTCPFTKEFASYSPEEFVGKILIGALHAKLVVVGCDFCFGKNRSGDVKTLLALAETYDFSVKVFDKCREDGREISSSLIRRCIEDGDISFANRLLGRPYFITGVVESGKKLGRTIGFPTINLYPSQEKLLPQNGVYETKIFLDGKNYTAMTNIGCNPTVDTDRKIKVETHIFDYEGDLYGKTVKLDFERFIRKEMKFDGIDTLKNQIKKDKITIMHQ